MTPKPDCEDAQLRIDREFAAELTDPERRELMRHLDECDDCRSHYDLLEELTVTPIEEPADADFLTMRREVIRSIRRGEAEPSHLLQWIKSPLLARVALVVVAAGVLFGLGVMTGRTREAEPVQAAAVQPASGDIVLARHIGDVARSNRGLADIESSPFRYSNVRVDEVSAESVRLRFDVSRNMELTLRRDEPLLTEVLVQSVLAGESVGEQLDAISAAGPVADPRVREALVKAMLNDPNLGVRLEAQARLASMAGEQSTNDAMLKVLEREASVQMRLLAIDYLTRSRVSPQRLEQAVNAGEEPGREAVYVKARNYIQSF